MLCKPLLPTPDRRPANADAAGDREDGQPLRRQKNDPCPLNVLLRTVAITDDGAQSRPVLGSDDHADSLCHARRLAWPERLVNPMIVSVH